MKLLVVGDFHGKFPKNLEKEAKNVDLVIALGDYAGIPEWTPFIMNQMKLIKKGEEPISPEEYFGKEKFRKMLKIDNEAGRRVLRRLNSLSNKVLFIFGNGDDAFYNYPFGDFFKASKDNKRFLKKIRHIQNITYSKVKFDGLDIAGFGGFIDPDSHLERKLLRTDRERYNRILKRQKKSRKKLFSILKGFPKFSGIFVFHYPPKGTFDLIKNSKNPYNGKNIGTSYLTEAIKKYSPRIVLCGHMHEYQGKKMLGKSLVVNPGTASEGKFAVIDSESLKVRFIKS